MKFINDISSNFFVYDKNWPSYDFLKIEKTNNLSRLELRPVPVRVKTRPG